MFRLTTTILSAAFLGALCLIAVAPAAEAQMVTRTVVTESYGEPEYYAPPQAVYYARPYGRPYGRPVYSRPHYYRYAPRPVIYQPYAPALFSFNIGGSGRHRDYNRGEGHHWHH